MAQNISVLGTHNLDLSTIEALANDLSKRFGFTIAYGYFHNDDFNKLLSSNLKYGFVTLGTIKNKGKLYKLNDNNFQKKQLFKMYGNALFEMQEYWNWKSDAPTKNEIENEIKNFDIGEINFELELVSSKAFQMINIYENVVNIDMNYYSRWSTFCDAILTREYFNDDLLRYRKAIMKNAFLLGSDSVYLINDQCSILGGVGQGEEQEYTWHELENFIKNKKDLVLISISKSVLDLEYQEEISKMNEIVAFYDDFEDLKTFNEI